MAGLVNVSTLPAVSGVPAPFKGQLTPFSTPSSPSSPQGAPRSGSPDAAPGLGDAAVLAGPRLPGRRHRPTPPGTIG